MRTAAGHISLQTNRYMQRVNREILDAFFNDQFDSKICCSTSVLAVNVAAQKFIIIIIKAVCTDTLPCVDIISMCCCLQLQLLEFVQGRKMFVDMKYQYEWVHKCWNYDVQSRSMTNNAISCVDRILLLSEGQNGNSQVQQINIKHIF